MLVERWLTTADLAVILCISTKRVQNMLSENPEQLPPRSNTPGLRGSRFAAHIVAQWQSKRDPATCEPNGKKKIGRPTKAEQIKRRNELAHALA
jgi:hypothetical protein